MTQVLIKRAYEGASRNDGFRVLVDRIWPRGVTKQKLRVHVWAKEIAPSTALRQWFGHDPDKWSQFRERYGRELRSPDAKRTIESVIEQAQGQPTITLVYGASDTLHNQAVVLRDLFERTLSRRGSQNGPAK